MKIGERIKEINSTYMTNTRECRKYREGIEIFDKMVRAGFTQERGNRLASIDEEYTRKVEFNSCTPNT